MSSRQRDTGITRRQALGGIASAGALAAIRRPAEAAHSWGRVFIFNTASEPVSLRLNKIQLPTIVGTQRDDYYIPDVIVVDRTGTPPALVLGEFASENVLNVRYPGRESDYEIAIDPMDVKVHHDLQLYVHRDGVVLLNNGAAVGDRVRRIS